MDRSNPVEREKNGEKNSSPLAVVHRHTTEHALTPSNLSSGSYRNPPSAFRKKVLIRVLAPSHKFTKSFSVSQEQCRKLISSHLHRNRSSYFSSSTGSASSSP